MPTVIETARLVMRPFEADDVEAAFTWLSDPVVMQFIPGGPDLSIDQTRARLAKYEEHQTTHGYSKWIIIDRASCTAIGDSGLLDLREYGWIDLGFRLSRTCWGKGLATEAAAAWVRAAFKDLHFHRLCAFAHLENVASIRVLKKLGFSAGSEDRIMGMRSIIFSLDAKDVQPQTPTSDDYMS